jgi:hypothetical protein
MFQYAAGRALSIRSGVQLKLDIYDLVDRTPQPDFVHRDCDLGLLMAPLDFASLADLGRAYEKSSSLSRRLTLRYRRELLRKNTFKEKSQQFLAELIETNKKNAYLFGYWHDARYFEDFRDVIVKDFVMRGDLVSDYADKILNSDSVCLHVRRTDFVNISAEREYRTQCDEAYYRQAIDVVLEKHRDVQIFGFSDDVKWCEENLKLQLPVTWIPESESGVKGGKHFWLMRQCKHFIIPNSTFAWWAAWLSEIPDNVVVCPQHWYNDPDEQSEGLIPKHWTAI